MMWAIGIGCLFAGGVLGVIVMALMFVSRDSEERDREAAKRGLTPSGWETHT